MASLLVACPRRENILAGDDGYKAREECAAGLRRWKEERRSTRRLLPASVIARRDASRGNYRKLE